MKLYKHLYQICAGEDQTKRMGQNSNFDVPTFENRPKTWDVITALGLATMVQKLGMDQKKPTKQVREEVSNLAKQINQHQGRTGLPLHKVSELNFDGFLEFIIQITYTTHLDEADLTAARTLDIFFQIVKEHREAYNLPKHYFYKERKTAEDLKLTPAMQVAIENANPCDVQVVTEVSTILAEIIQKIEKSNDFAFSKRFAYNRYISKKTQRRLDEEAKQKALADEAEEEARRKRAAKFKLVMAERERRFAE